MQVIRTVRSGARIFGSGNYINAHCLCVSVVKLAGVKDWRNKIVYLCADGASVNLGRDNGVAAKLRREVDYLIACHWFANRLELGITKQSKTSRG